MPIASVEELRAAVRRTAAVGRARRGQPIDDPLRSWLGRVTVLGEGESWPVHDGRPMFGLAQLNLTESPFVPAELAGLSMVTIFLAEGDGWFIDPSDRPNGDGWALRTYETIDDLQPTDGPVLDGVTPRQLDWQLVDDYPAWDDLESAVGDETVESILGDQEPSDVLGSPAEGPKLGGWPSTIQGELSWAPWNEHPASPSFCIQIDGDAATNLAPLGSGVLYLGLGGVEGAPVWVATTQFP